MISIFTSTLNQHSITNLFFHEKKVLSYNFIFCKVLTPYTKYVSKVTITHYADTTNLQVSVKLNNSE